MAKYIFGCLGVRSSAFILGIIVFALGADGYNQLVNLKQGVDAQWAEVQNQYERRADLIPNLVQTVSGAANFEKSTLEAVIEARASVGQVKLDPSQRPPTRPSSRNSSRPRGARQRAFPPARRHGKLPRPQGQPEFSRSPGPIGRHRKPHRDGAQSLQRGRQSYNTAVQSFPTVSSPRCMAYHPALFPSEGTGQRRTPLVNFDFNTPTNAAPAQLVLLSKP